MSTEWWGSYDTIMGSSKSEGKTTFLWSGSRWKSTSNFKESSAPSSFFLQYFYDPGFIIIWDMYHTL